ncbi:hypothetical protein LINPERPRIM_LOCUS35276 [Linum perenne]
MAMSASQVQSSPQYRAPNPRNFHPNMVQGGFQRPPLRGPRPQQGQYTPKHLLYCTHCKFTGHTYEECWKRIGYPPGYGPRYPQSPRPQAAAATTVYQPGVIDGLSSLNLTPEQYHTFIMF